MLKGNYFIQIKLGIVQTEHRQRDLIATEYTIFE